MNGFHLSDRFCFVFFSLNSLHAHNASTFYIFCEILLLRIMNGRSVSEYQQDEGDGSKLILPRLHRNMTGEVKCRVYNDYGAEFSNAAKITVVCKSEIC